MRKIKVTFFERFGEYAHKCKENLLIKCKSPKQRWIVLIFSLSIIPLVSGMLIQNDVGQFFMSLGFCFLLVFCSLGLCYCQVAQRGLYRNIIFIVIFLIGVISYMGIARFSQLYHTEYRIKLSDKEININSMSPHSVTNSFWRNLFSVNHYNHSAFSSFFLSRGNYEIDSSGAINGIALPWWVLASYIIFHALVFCFAGYFLMSLWGYRTLNRLKFWLTADREKNVFWCIKPEPQMLKLAKDILVNGGNYSQPVFSVEKMVNVEHKAIFQEMNFQNFCLKLRYPDQIHKKCLLAARHFFLSEDSDWNIDMAQKFLSYRREYGIKKNTQLYIKISDEERKIFFNRWADVNNIPGQVEIILIDEAEMIAEKFVAENPMLDTLRPTVIDTQNATIPNGEFKVLVIGFGRIGRSVLKHIICDCQFVKNLNKELYRTNYPSKNGIDNNEITFHFQRERVPFSADIIDHDTKCWEMFQHNCKEAVERFNLNFIPMEVLTKDFFNLKWENLKNYSRIIVALGDVDLNIEVAATIENIIRKKIPLPSSEKLEGTGDPQKQLEKMKKRCFLISPEIHNWHDNGECSANLFNNDENLFSLVGANYDIYNCENIIEEKLSVMAKFVALCYCINYYGSLNEEQKMNRLKHAELRMACGLPVIPWDRSLEGFCSLLPNQKKKIMKSWYTSYDANTQQLKAEPMYGRKSSRAAAANLKNILTLLGLNESEEALIEYRNKIKSEELKNNLSRTEHLRWMAYMLLDGCELWHAPLKTAEVSKANQSTKFYRHATLVEYEKLSKIDKIFPAKKTFREKDLEIIENLPLFYEEFWAINE